MSAEQIRIAIQSPESRAEILTAAMVAVGIVVALFV